MQIILVCLLLTITLPMLYCANHCDYTSIVKMTQNGYPTGWRIPTSCTHLSLFDSNITSHDWNFAVKAILKHPFLRYLNLGRNQIGDEMLIKVSTCFKASLALETLIVSEVGISDIGLAAIMEQIHGHERLRHLNFEGNRFTPTVLGLFQSSLSSLPELSLVELGRSFYVTKSLTAFVEGMRRIGKDVHVTIDANPDSISQRESSLSESEQPADNDMQSDLHDVINVDVDHPHFEKVLIVKDEGRADAGDILFSSDAFFKSIGSLRIPSCIFDEGQMSSLTSVLIMLGVHDMVDILNVPLQEARDVVRAQGDINGFFGQVKFQWLWFTSLQRCVHIVVCLRETSPKPSGVGMIVSGTLTQLVRECDTFLANAQVGIIPKTTEFQLRPNYQDEISSVLQEIDRSGNPILSTEF